MFCSNFVNRLLTSTSSPLAEIPVTPYGRAHKLVIGNIIRKSILRKITSVLNFLKWRFL